MDIRAQLFTLRMGITDPDVLNRLMEQAADAGFNMVLLEVGEAFAYRRHPELSSSRAFTHDFFAGLAGHARKLGLSLVPYMATFSHTHYIMDVYPEFRESSPGVYCSSRPGLYPLLFDLMEEIIQAFEPAYFHIGHDEAVSSYDTRQRTSVLVCPDCRRQEPASVFKRDILRIHDFLSRHNIRTMMWADSLLDPDDFPEAGFAGSGCYGGPPDNLQTAIDTLPRDILMCDWHYEPAREYPTLLYLQEKGFDTLGCTWFEYNSYTFTRYALEHRTEKFKGMMATSWIPLNAENYSTQKRICAWNGRIFNSMENSASFNSLTRRIDESCRSWDRPLEDGDFRKVYTFDLGGAGVLHSLGWKDMRYIERNGSTTVFSGPVRPRSMEIKPGRKGEIKYRIKAGNNRVFERLCLKAWFDCPGRNSVMVRAEDGEFIVLSSDTALKGRKLDLSSLALGRNSVILKFEAENEGEERVPVLKRFEIEGRNIEEKCHGRNSC
ncbi:MAG: family 20 glycosylhydrolase [bacterium]|nr:family 20 glycosylhydrolase [bacterium]